MRTNKLTDDEKEQIKHLYLIDLLSTQAVARRINRSPAAVFQYLKQHDLVRTIGEAGRLALKLKRKIMPSMLGYTGDKSPNWKGGRCHRSDGYISILCRKHPSADYGGRVLEHRLVMEEYLGRYLLPTEIVHHINGVRDDNRLENLELTQSKKGHGKLHPNIVCPHCGKHFILVNGKPINGFI